jgi:predicted amidohydrolase YtcJ
MPLRWALLFAVSACLAASGAARAQTLPPEIVSYADLVLYNGRIHTVNAASEIVQAVAIRDGTFLAVGTNERARSMAGPATVLIDVQGRTVVPGFIGTDADNSFSGGNLYKDTQIGGTILDSFDDEKKADILARIAAVVSKASPGEMVFVRFGASVDTFEITRWDLDAVSPNNPLYMSLDGSGIANSAMLAKVLERLPKEHPHIVKNAAGEPTGQVYGFASGVVGWDLRPWPRVDLYVEDQKTRIAELNEKGLTTAVGHIQGFTLTLLNLLAHRGELNLRVRGAHDFLRQNYMSEAYLRRLGNLVDFGIDDMIVIVGGGLQNIDGSADEGGLLSLERKRSSGGYGHGPYGSHKWIGFGVHDRRWDDPSIDRSKTEWATAMAAIQHGWNFTAMHNAGDAATAVWLEAIDKGLAQPGLLLKPQFRPFGLDHNHFWSDGQTELVQKFDVRRGLGKMFQRPDRAIEIYGDKIHDVQPVPKLLQQGMKVHIEGTEPLEEIERYVTRRDDRNRLWGPDHAIDRATALRMKTLWAARFIGEDDRLGSIEPGKLADLVVLGQDYMTVPDVALSDIPIVMTVVDGRIVFRKGL